MIVLYQKLYPMSDEAINFGYIWDISYRIPEASIRNYLYFSKNIIIDEPIKAGTLKEFSSDICSQSTYENWFVEGYFVPCFQTMTLLHPHAVINPR